VTRGRERPTGVRATEEEEKTEDNDVSKGMNWYLTSQGTREDGIFEVYSHLGTVPTPVVSTNKHRDEVCVHK
jgi:hypothetical protein